MRRVRLVTATGRSQRAAARRAPGGTEASARFVGIGLQAFGNLNTQAPFAGLALMLFLGWMP